MRFEPFCRRPDTVQTTLRTPGYFLSYSAHGEVLFKVFVDCQIVPKPEGCIGSAQTMQNISQRPFGLYCQWKLWNLSNHFKPLQTIANHCKPFQTISNHFKPFQTIKSFRGHPKAILAAIKRIASLQTVDSCIALGTHETFHTISTHVKPFQTIPNSQTIPRTPEPILDAIEPTQIILQMPEGCIGNIEPFKPFRGQTTITLNYATLY